jgi:hypothetical protein
MKYEQQIDRFLFEQMSSREESLFLKRIKARGCGWDSLKCSYEQKVLELPDESKNQVYIDFEAFKK